MKRWHELAFSHGNACYLCHQQVFGFDPADTDWQEWLDELDHV